MNKKNNRLCLYINWHEANEEPPRNELILEKSTFGWEVDRFDSREEGPWKRYVKEWDVKGWLFLDDLENSINKLKYDNCRNGTVD